MIRPAVATLMTTEYISTPCVPSVLKYGSVTVEQTLLHSMVRKKYTVIVPSPRSFFR